jgi:hypothetical protein
VKLAVCLAVVVAAFTAAAIRPVSAAAATPCWKVLLTDWYDGRIDNTYPLHCYEDAMKHLPADVSQYSSAREDIQRALQSAKARLSKSGQTVTPTTPIPPSTTPRTTTSKTGTTPTDTGPTPTTPLPGRKPDKGLSEIADKLNPSSPSSLPLPLLVLGALALLLVAAGGVGLVVKRRQGREIGPS